MLAIAGNSNHCTKASLGDIPKDNGEKKKIFPTGITLATRIIFRFVYIVKYPELYINS